MLKFFSASTAITGFLVLMLATGCNLEPVEPVFVPEEGEILMGGTNNTVADHSENAFSFQSPALKGLDELNFFVGNSFFNQNWVTAPASTTARDGLGPVFNARSCSACHFKDGRGKAPDFAGELSTGFLLRLSVPGTAPHGGPLPEPHYGGQLNDQAIPGFLPEGKIQITYTENPGTFPDGETYSLRKPTYQITDLNYGIIDPSVVISPRVGQQMIGLGLLEAIDENDILAYIDEADLNQDGISGRANYVHNYESSTTTLGRFGWKANQPSLKQQTAGALLGDLGITTSLFLEENCPGNPADCLTMANGGLPELEDDDLEKTVLYVSSLAVPARRNATDQNVLAGKRIFSAAGCANCHIPSYTTGIHPQFAHLSGQKIWPFTDLLLHDMGPGLADDRPDYRADGKEWRTQPLWGIGLFSTVNRHTYYLHDGRARNLKEAILWHGGEAESSVVYFKSLSRQGRESLIEFLNSL